MFRFVFFVLFLMPGNGSDLWKGMGSNTWVCVIPKVTELLFHFLLIKFCVVNYWVIGLHICWLELGGNNDLSIWEMPGASHLSPIVLLHSPASAWTASPTPL
jgi:hypothetical protein